MKYIFTAAILLVLTSRLVAQQDLSQIVEENTQTNAKEYVTATFKGLKIINAETIETCKKHDLEFDIQHRFGDVATNGNVNVHTFFGLDQASDIRFAFEYGITDRLQAGIGRSRGIEPYRELYDFNLKYKLLQQTTNNKMPLSVTLFGVAGVSGRKSSTDSTSDAYYEGNWSHRWSYVTQAIIARKFSPGVSFEIVPTWTHRNYVDYQDENDMFSLGIGGRVKITKRMAIIADYFHNFSQYRADAKDANGNKLYFDPLSIGLEIETGGHVFQLMFTNSEGILENSYLPQTKSNWGDGEFRWGFNLSRNFTLGGKKW